MADLDWVKVVSPNDQKLVKELMLELDPGESESIALALENQADYLIIDEYKGRMIAESLGLPIVGILGVLIQAKQHGIIADLKEEIEKLRSVGFRLNQNLVNSVLAKIEK